MSEGSVPGSPPNTSNKVMLRNIITGVITTVVGAITVYFLLGRKSDTSSEANMLLMKEATNNAWKSYVLAENVFFSSCSVLAENSGVIIPLSI